ncbi:deoxynucleoside kinase [Sporolactobacillus sp. THM19-2]|jgi:deoxyadenosine/deoxycytidine kinase|uniref:deoxynucleoside kinase n=1 Tax=Sporolactobacillus sp. THM19-2 TaxID=2511171 RepID=UPI00101F64A0|nr:deoxynucleoside kinase [Sporolactobacillus sp. THM19-2]RYL94192.1 deoxynucleoside kinase [Sporolactobacillus sp. THM19-2]
MEETRVPSKCLITVAGMVGIGKTTFTKALAHKLHYHTSLEKVDGNPYLDAFYRDFKRWVFQLQIYFLGERFKESRRIEESPYGFVQDRSIYEDTDIFARMHYEKGNMSRADYRTYTSLFEAMVMTPYFHHPDLLIYLRGSLDATIRRINRRGRGLEKETPVSYWTEMHQRYEKWISHFNFCPVLQIDIDDYDLVGDPNSFSRIIPLIKDKLTSGAVNR